MRTTKHRVNYSFLYSKFVKEANQSETPFHRCDRKKWQGTGFEVHHVLPKSLKGSNSPENLVLLTHEDHIFAHLLLNLSLIQDGKQDVVNKLAYPNLYRELKLTPEVLDDERVFNGFKIAFSRGGKAVQIMTVRKALHFVCMITYRNPDSRQDQINTFAHMLYMAIMKRKIYGYTLSVVFK